MHHEINAQQEQKLRRQHWQEQRTAAVYLAFNFVSTIATTFLAKHCLSKVQFGYPAALCNVHYVITWIGIECMQRLKMFEPLSKPPSLHDPQFAAIVILVGTVAPLNNTSLKLNSVGFYQIFKLLVTPGVVFLNYILDGKTLSKARSWTLIAVCAFVLISSVSDFEYSVYGTICASIWVPLSAGYKVQWGRVLQQHRCSTPALMKAVLPYAIVVQTTLIPLVDPPGVLRFQWTTEAVFWIGLSGVAAFLVNLSGFLVMGNVGALAHVLLGQVKTSVICLGAYYLFGARYSKNQLLGAAGAVVAIVVYAHVTATETTTERKKMITTGGGTVTLPLIKKDSNIVNSST